MEHESSGSRMHELRLTASVSPLLGGFSPALCEMGGVG